MKNNRPILPATVMPHSPTRTHTLRYSNSPQPSTSSSERGSTRTTEHS